VQQRSSGTAYGQIHWHPSFASRDPDISNRAFARPKSSRT
jgi:hypothetical protein